MIKSSTTRDIINKKSPSSPSVITSSDSTESLLTGSIPMVKKGGGREIIRGEERKRERERKSLRVSFLIEVEVGGEEREGREKRMTYQI